MRRWSHDHLRCSLRQDLLALRQQDLFQLAHLAHSPRCTRLLQDTCPFACMQGRLALLQHDYSALSSSLATIQELGRSVAQFREAARQAAARAVADHEVGPPLQHQKGHAALGELLQGSPKAAPPHKDPQVHRPQAHSRDEPGAQFQSWRISTRAL